MCGGIGEEDYPSFNECNARELKMKLLLKVPFDILREELIDIFLQYVEGLFINKIVYSNCNV